MDPKHKKYEENYTMSHQNQVAQTSDKKNILKADREKGHVYMRNKQGGQQISHQKQHRLEDNGVTPLSHTHNVQNCMPLKNIYHKCK